MMHRQSAGTGQCGYSLMELLTVVALTTIILAVTVPNLLAFYRRHQVESAAGTVQTLVQRARMSALKERTAYRVLIHDESALTPNTLELQQSQGGSFVTVPGQVFALNAPVHILGSSPTDSIDGVTVNSRGQCSSGNVFVRRDGAELGTVSIAATCFMETP